LGIDDVPARAVTNDWFYIYDGDGYARDGFAANRFQHEPKRSVLPGITR